MNIYTVTPHIDGGYDSYDGHVVVADTPDEALRLVLADGIGDEGKKAYALADVVKIGLADEGIAAAVILSSFNAG